MAKKQPNANGLPSGANLFVAPMEWNLDEFLRAEISDNGLPVHLVDREEDADFGRVDFAGATEPGPRGTP